MIEHAHLAESALKMEPANFHRTTGSQPKDVCETSLWHGRKSTVRIASGELFNSEGILVILQPQNWKEINLPSI